MEQQKDLTIDQVASIVQVNRRTVEKWIQGGLLKAYEVNGRYRITPEALEAFKANRQVQPKQREQSQDEESGEELQPVA